MRMPMDLPEPRTRRRPSPAQPIMPQQVWREWAYAYSTHILLPNLRRPPAEDRQ